MARKEGDVSRNRRLRHGDARRRYYSAWREYRFGCRFGMFAREMGLAYVVGKLVATK